MTEADKRSKRLLILSSEEIEAFYARPNFNDEERQLYFALNPQEEAALAQLRTVYSRMAFILQLGYFKTCQRFFVFEMQEVLADAQFVQARYFPKAEVQFEAITKVTRLKQQALVLQLMDYRICGRKERQDLREKAEALARIDSQPIFILRELLQDLQRQRIIAPAYSWFQEMLGQILAAEQMRLIETVKEHLSQAEEAALYYLLSNPNGQYEITQLKHSPRHFGNKELKLEIARGQSLQTLYEMAQRVLPHLQISNESIKYYASLVDYYSVFQLNQLRSSLALVYLLCFVHYRYQSFQDTLIKAFLYRLGRYLEAAKAAAQVAVYEQNIRFSQNLQKAGEVLKLFTDESQFPSEGSVKPLRQQAYTIIQQAELEQVAHQLSQTLIIDETALQWQALDKLARHFKLSLRPLLRSLQLQAKEMNSPLMEVFLFLRASFERKEALNQLELDEIPMDFVSSHLKKYLFALDAKGKREFLADRYEFLAYRQLRQDIESGMLFCANSLQYRRFEADLLSDERWQKKEQLLQESHLPILQLDIQKHLQEFEERLERRLKEVNERIAAGENTAVQLRSRGSKRRWSLPQSALKTAVNHPFFDSLPQVDIYSLLHFVQQRCSFMDEFQHLLARHGSRDFDASALMAAQVAWGTNTGVGRMGQISDIPQHELSRISDNFLRPQTLHPANGRIINHIASLPIFQAYMIDQRLHSSSDGQKFETAFDSFNARHSPKYFGLKKGIVAYTLIANHVPINARIIGAHEHESHYVFDLLFNNSTKIQPQIHSTDVHGINQLNFALLHIFGYQFAPRYADIYQQFQTGLHGFKAPQDYPDDWLIKPVRKIRQDFIIPEWDNIQRMMVSLALKTSSQSIVISKLHAFPRQHRTRRALAEYDNIVRSLYLLDYLDTLDLRLNVQRALNRGESYHQLRRAVAYANFGKLRFRTEYEQELWQECSRLLTNAIVAYNSTILSNLLLHHLEKGNTQQAALLSRVSPIAWQHINFYGHYEFTKTPDLIDVDSLVQQLAQFDIALLEL